MPMIIICFASLLSNLDWKRENVDYLLHLCSLRYWEKPILQYVSKSSRHCATDVQKVPYFIIKIFANHNL